MPNVPVYFNTFLMGRVILHDEGTLSFTYDQKWLQTPQAFPISVTMPMSSDEYGNELIAPWLANLLPEEQQLDLLSRTLGVSRADTIALLTEIGGDTAGALSFGEPVEPDKWRYVPLTEFYGEADPQQALARHFEDLKHRPFLVGEEGVRLSLAGGQEKSALAVLDSDGNPVLRLPDKGDVLAIPVDGAPSTVIIKPDNPNLPGITENEVYCLSLADAVGMDAAKVSILTTGERNAICVLRYDRVLTRQGTIMRLHQEDFAQANSLPPGRKYERGSLPGLTMEQLLQTRFRISPTRADPLVDQVIFNILVANTDAHAKNYSLLLPLGGRPALAPLYDVSTVLPWQNRQAGIRVIQTYAQKLAGKVRKPGDLTQRHWDAIAEEGGIRQSVLTGRVKDMVDRMVAKKVETVAKVSAMSGAEHGYVEEAANFAEQNALRILGRLSR